MFEIRDKKLYKVSRQMSDANRFQNSWAQFEEPSEHFAAVFVGTNRSENWNEVAAVDIRTSRHNELIPAGEYALWNHSRLLFNPGKSPKNGNTTGSVSILDSHLVSA